jgi:hypothetical protein
VNSPFDQGWVDSIVDHGIQPGVWSVAIDCSTKHVFDLFDGETAAKVAELAKKKYPGGKIMAVVPYRKQSIDPDQLALAQNS